MRRKFEKYPAFAELRSYWLAGEMWKCKSYLAGISLSYCSSGLSSVFEDSPCSPLLGLTLISRTVVSNGCGDSTSFINSSQVLFYTLFGYFILENYCFSVLSVDFRKILDSDSAKSISNLVLTGQWNKQMMAFKLQSKMNPDDACQAFIYERHAVYSGNNDRSSILSIGYLISDRWP